MSDNNFTYNGCWPTMITPFKANGQVEYDIIPKLVDWYIDHGSDGIFAVCQSSEMFFLTEEEKLAIARSVVEANRGRIKVIASGHTADDKNDQIEQLGAMAETGVDAVVLVSNRIAKKEESNEIFFNNISNIFTQLPNVTFGLYECPYPYLRLLSDDFLRYAALENKLTFLKDVSCSQEIQKRRVECVKGSKLALFNANTSTVLSSLKMGYVGYNGVMANFHIDIYKWLYEHYKEDNDLVNEVNDFLTIAGAMESRLYPTCAKLHFQKTDIPDFDLFTRSKNHNELNENIRHEIDSLITFENRIRAKIRK